MAEAQGVKWTQPGFIVAMPSAVVFLGFLAGAVAWLIDRVSEN